VLLIEGLPVHVHHQVAVLAGCPARPVVPDYATPLPWTCPGEDVCPAAEALAWAASERTAPGPEVLRLVELAGTAALCPRARRDLLVAVTRLQSSLVGVAAQATAALGDTAAEHLVSEGPMMPGQVRAGLVRDSGREEVAVGLRVSPGSAAYRLREARSLTGPGHRDLLAALLAGRTTSGHAREVLEVTARWQAELDAEHADGLAGELIAHPRVERALAVSTVQGLRRIVAEVAARLDPVTPQEGETTGPRGVTVGPAGNGTARTEAFTSALDGAALHAAISTAVRRAHEQGDPRSSGEIEAETLADWAWQALGTTRPDTLPDPDPDPDTAADPVLPPAPDTALPADDAEDADGGADGDADRAAAAPAGVGVPAAGELLDLGIVVSLETLAGFVADPARLAGLGPLSAPLVRALAAQASRCHLLVTDNNGQLLSVSRTYRFTPLTARTVKKRYGGRCGFPGCWRRGQDLDHVQPWSKGGPTSPDNVIPLCRRHHNLVTHHGWQHDLDTRTGRIAWTSPLGTRSTVDPLDYRPITAQPPPSPPPPGPVPPQPPPPF